MIRSLHFISFALFSMALVLAACTSKEAPAPAVSTPAPAPKVEASKPAAPATAGGVITTTAKDAGKTADVAKGVAKDAAEPAAALACSRDGCTKAGLESIKLVHGGKTFNFCGAACVAEYKKANNLE